MFKHLKFDCICLFSAKMIRLKNLRRAVILIAIISIFSFITYYMTETLFMEDNAWQSNLIYYLETGAEIKNQTSELEQGSQNRKYKTNYTSEFWNSIRSQVDHDCLYPKTFDVDPVVTALREAKVINALLFDYKHSLKFKVKLEGGQTAVFKVMNM